MENENVQIAEMFSNPPYNFWTIITPTARRPPVSSGIASIYGFYLDETEREQYYFTNEDIIVLVNDFFKNKQQSNITVNREVLIFFRNEKGVPMMRVRGQTYKMFSKGYDDK